MKSYDNYNPEIPYTDDSPGGAAELPPAPAVTREKIRREKAKQRNPKSASGKGKSQSEAKTTSSGAASKTLSAFVTAMTRIFTGQNIKFLFGLLLGCMGVYLAVAFISYFTDCMHDQAIVNNSPMGASDPVRNAGGEGGARISEFLINECFGLGSFVLVVWLFAMSLKQLAGRPRFKSVDFTIKCIVALLTVSLIIGLLTIGLNTSVNWGGYHGRYVNEFIVHFFGWTGAVVLCIFMLATFVVICLRDFINWIIRLRREASRRRAIALEERRRREELERQRAEMIRQEAIDAEKAGEASLAPEADPDDAHVTFNDTDADPDGMYYNLPDIDEEDTDAPLLAVTNVSPVSPVSPVAPVSPVSPAQQEAPAATSDHSIIEEGENTAADTLASMEVNVNHISEYTDSSRPEMPGLPGSTPYTFPPYDLLREGEAAISVDDNEQLENKERIRKTLLDFKIPIISIRATVGPTITLYEIVPDKGVRTSKIRSLVDDIALRLEAEGVRIIPIPGKGTVGIEVANKNKQTVSMRTVIKSRKYQECRYKLPIALGSTISNEVYIADLAKMPHLLVAGATGQGKSVGLNAIIASLLYRKSPDELKFVMIDPKMVEFSLYAKIEQHYLAKLPGEEDPIITDMTRVVATLSSLCVEMDDRYQLLKMAQSARNIEEYNAKILAGKLNPDEGHRYLPYIVIVVDEFSDLIMQSGKEVEMPIARLAQKARAVGMHVIIATQRPSTNVITGIIKANFPARIAFKVSSGVDSKTILDTSGAQQLIGRGDMLISNSSEIDRVQCAFIDTPEVEAICEYIEKQPGAPGPYILPEPIVGNSEEEEIAGGTFGDRDPLFDEVARTIVNSNTASTSSLQRRYSIGYNRAGKIMDQLEAAGIVGPSHGGKPRAVLVDAVTLESILN